MDFDDSAKFDLISGKYQKNTGISSRFWRGRLELKPLADGGSRFCTNAYSRKWISSYFSDRHRCSMKMLSKQRPRPSMLMAIPRTSSSSVNFGLVNCEPWSVLKIFGRPGQRLLQRL